LGSAGVPLTDRRLDWFFERIPDESGDTAMTSPSSPTEVTPLAPTSHGFSSVESLLTHLGTPADEVSRFREKANDRLLLDHLVAYRVKCGYSQKDMAQHLNCSQSKISKFENGLDSTTEIGEARRYAKVIGIDLSLFVTRHHTKLADQVRIHTEMIRKLLNQLLTLAAGDESMRNGTKKLAVDAIVENLKPVLNLFEIQLKTADEKVQFPVVEAQEYYFDSAVAVERREAELVG
jgi:transcriptional regulator with XRE-family HTH domain